MSEKFYKFASPTLAFIFIILALRIMGSSSQGASRNDNNINDPRLPDSRSIEVVMNNPLPVDRAAERVTKKPFGIYVTPKNSPVQPERFAGYHTGTDFEIFPGEEDLDVTVFALKDGKVLYKQWVNGYGGVLIQSATIDNNPVTILYGHLNIGSIDKKIGDNLAEGERIGVLGKGYSQETGGERKHLHLAVYRGKNINLRGYVSDRRQLNSWMNPMDVLSANP